VLFCDLDHFRRINDTYGHRCGDHVLVAAGQRFANVLRPADTIGRIDGDKFVVICPVVSAPEAMAMAERLLGCLENPFAVSGHTVRVTASIGVAVADGSKSDPESLLRDADHAVFQAKRDGRERAVLFSSSMRPRTTAGGAEQLRVALAQDQFRLVYQPVVSSFDGSIIGVEALLRWDHPALGVVMPSDFIPQLEETGLIVEVGRWVLRESCRQAAEWIAAFPGLSLRTTVNVSARQLAEPDFRDTVASALNEAGLRPEGLCLELTEGTMLLDTVAAWARLREVKLLGVGLALDDFGTGFSSLSFVRQFSVDMIKIDRSFVQGVTLNAEDRAIVAAVAGIANGLGIVCVAEGVETREQALELRALGCGLLQGHLASPPAAPEQITAMLAADASRRSREAVVLDGR
jgi:diguanylate cyclase (GGDEF)-like protein